MTASVSEITAWLNSLADVTSGGSDPVTAERIATMTGLLDLDRYSAAAFTFASMRHVASRHRFFPSYAELRETLHGWWIDNRPAVATLPSQGGDGLTKNDRDWLEFYHRLRADIWAEGREFTHGSREGDLASLASLIRQEAPKAWAVIAGSAPANPVRTVDAIAAVTKTMTAHREWQKSRPLEPAKVEAPALDVTLKGEALRLSRERRGIRVEVRE